jgi:hypothetical protein
MTDEAKTPAKTPEMAPQEHGGAIRRGGTNRGGPGRPPSAIRATAREKFDRLIPKLDQIARARKSKDSDKVRAIDVLGKYGMGQAVSVEDVKACLRQTTEEIREFLPPEQAEVLLGRIRPIWLNL